VDLAGLNLGPLTDGRLLFICVLAGVVALLNSTTAASRPAAVITRRVAMSVAIFQIFFLITRFANLLYLPILARFVDRAVDTGRVDLLLTQIRWVAGGAAVGALIALVLLPSFIQIYVKGIRSLEGSGSMIKVLARTAWPGNWGKILECLRRPNDLGAQGLSLSGIPAGFLIFNVFATAIWTVGALCAIYVSAEQPQAARTAVLLSGLVNALAAIMFSVVVDPKAAHITDQAVAGQRPANHVSVVAFYLMLGNILGAILGQAVLVPGAKVISWATTLLTGGTEAGGGADLLLVIMINILVTMLASTTVVSSVSAVITRRVATAIAVYNVFFLITRLAQQVYAPLVGTIVDGALPAHGLPGPETIHALEMKLRLIVLGASAGVALGWALLPTFVEIYRKAINGMDRFGSMPRLLLALLTPRAWLAVARCLRRPSFLGVGWSQLGEIPRGFLLANVVVVSIYTVGVIAATFASAIDPANARTATLLSSVVNGVATVLISLVVDPVMSLITDQSVLGRRPEWHVKVMAVFLIGGMFLGTLLSQLIFMPCVWIIASGAGIIARMF